MNKQQRAEIVQLIEEYGDVKRTEGYCDGERCPYESYGYQQEADQILTKIISLLPVEDENVSH